MPKKEEPLPKPPKRPYGRRNNFDEQMEQAGSLIADRMAQAAAEGKLEEFMKQEMPDNEYARNLAGMMMDMTGMLPGSPGISPPEAKTDEPHTREESPSTEVPDDVRQAIMGGDVQSLMGLLKQEHARRNPDSSLKKEEKTEVSPPRHTSAVPQMPTIDKELVDALVRIANDNNVTLDWIILRAIKIYVQEFEKTGKL